MSWLSIALLACAVVLLAAAEWPRLEDRFGAQARQKRERARRKAQLRVLHSGDADDREEFAASVERDLSRLPTIEERDSRRR